MRAHLLIYDRTLSFISPTLLRVCRVHSYSYMSSYEAWKSWTHAEYVPEYFWIRAVFYAAITALAFANTFLSPDYLIDGAQDGVGALQTLRFCVCAAALLSPALILLALMPHKKTSRWKLPLRLLFSIVSIGMLALNAVAWGAPRDDATWLAVITFLSYALLLLCWGLLATLAGAV